MGRLDEFLQRLLTEGRIVFGRSGPGDGALGRATALAVLERAFAVYRLDVAGPMVPFEPDVAFEAARLVQRAAWALVQRDQRPEDLERGLTMDRAPLTPAHHLSADLTLRYAAQLHQRARALDPADVLTRALAEVLRQWPLSGVLSDLDDGPATPPDLGEHPGVLLLYAERLARREPPAWRPRGKARDYVELVLHGLGRDRSPLLAVEGGGHE